MSRRHQITVSRDVDTTQSTSTSREAEYVKTQGFVTIFHGGWAWQK